MISSGTEARLAGLFSFFSLFENEGYVCLFPVTGNFTRLPQFLRKDGILA